MKHFAVLLCATLVLAPLWADADPKPDDFDGAMTLSGREGSLLRLEIPEEVYRGLRRTDSGDIRIFDAAGQSIPFVIRKIPKETFTPAPQEVPFFIWDSKTDKSLPDSTDIEINTSGGVVRIKNRGEVPQKSGTWLVDLSLLEYAPSTLTVKIESGGNNFNSPVSIQYSADLSSWKFFNKRQTLASFKGASGESVLDTLDLPEVEDNSVIRYLLVTLAEDTPSPSLMSAGFSPRETPSEYHEVTVQGVKSADGKRVNYETGAFYPMESLDFVLAETDSIPALIKYRFDKNEAWINHHQVIIYRYNSAESGEETTVKNPPFEIISRAPFWELEAAEEIIFSAAPGMVIRWEKRELIFPARGRGPWTLAYGNAAYGPLASELRLPDLRPEELENAVFTGDNRYAKTSPEGKRETNYSVYLLWAFLGAAALILTILAFAIAKSMKK